MKRNDIVMVDLPPPLGGAGREQAGRRPAVVAQYVEQFDAELRQMLKL